MLETVTILDLETTGTDPETAQIVELATLDVGVDCSAQPVGTTMGYLRGQRINPGVSIPPEASAVHHIVNADVADAPKIEDFVPYGCGEGLGAVDIIAGHNVAHYDLPIIRRLKGWPPEGVPILDTLRLARHLWPDIPSHKLEVLRYRYGLHPTKSQMHEIREAGTDRPHGTAFDVVVTANLLARAMMDVTIKMDGRDWMAYRTEGWRNVHEDHCGFGSTPMEAVADFSMETINVKEMKFGKHKGELVKDLPRDYIRWMFKQKDMEADNPDLFATIRRMYPPGTRGY